MQVILNKKFRLNEHENKIKYKSLRAKNPKSLIGLYIPIWKQSPHTWLLLTIQDKLRTWILTLNQTKVR